MRSFSAPTAIPSSCLPQYQVQNSFSQQNQAFLNSMAQPTFSLMPAVSYSTIPLGTSPTSTNAMLGSNMIQSQQPVIFSAAPGNYFLAQSAPLGAPVVGAPSFVFAPGQPNQNAFVVAHPLSQAPIAGHMAAHPNPANCVIRLPDGRFVLPATAPNNLNLQPSLTRICGPQSNYFPVSVSAPTSVNSSTISSLNPQVAQPPGQAFYIHMPTSCVSVGNTVFTTSQPNCGANFQTQPMSTMKPGCQVSFPNSQMNTLCGQSSGTLLTTVPGSNQQPQLGTRPLATNMNTVGSSLMNRPGLIFPTGCNPTTPVMDAYAAQNQQKLAVCTNPSQFTSLQALPSGMAVARLPNGTYATVSLSSAGMSGSTPIFVNNTPIPSTLANPVDTSNIPRRNTPTSRSKQKINNTPPADTDVLRRLDDQITALQRLPAPTEMQLNRLKQLVEVRQQLTKVSNMSSANSSNILAPRSSTTSSTATNTAPRQNSSSTSVQLTPTVRREVLDLLTQYNLVPRPPVANNNEETFIVEFRLNQQRYQLRLTRAQKADMERLLFNITSQRQAEVLTFFQQEQSRLLASTPRARLPPPPVSQSSNTTAAVASPPTVGFGIASQALRLPTGIQTFAAAPSLPMPTFPGASGLRLVAARPVVPPNAIPGSAVRPSVPPICSSTPVMGVVAALAVPPPMGTCVSSSMFAPALALNSTALSIPTVSSSLSMPSTVMSNTNVTSGLITAIPVTSFNSSVSGAQNFVLSTNSVAVNSTSSSTMLTPDTNGFAIQSLPQSTSFTLSSDSSNFVNSIRPVALNLQQAARIGRLRAYLTNDLKLAVEKPPVLSTSDTPKLPSPVELLEALAPYHVLNDADNTEEALNKVDKILEKSFNLLLEKKKETIETVNSLLFRESLQKLEPFLEDRLLLANMALDLERDIFTAEKEIFTEVTKHDKEEVSSNNCNPAVNPIESSKQEESTMSSKSTDHDDMMNRKRHSNKLTPILKHSTSLLPSPWCKLLGPLAYLHPLTFDVNGKASVAEIQLPVEEPECISLDDDDDEDVDVDTKNRSQSFVNSSTAGGDSSTFQSNTMIQSSHSENNNNTIVSTRNNNNDDDDEEINDESSDEAEADRLLGLGIPVVNRSKMDKNSTNGLLLDEDNRPIEGGIIKKCEEFDEAYDFWQELMHERDMHIEDMNTSLLENTFNDESNSMDEPPNKSLRLLDNGQSHSVSTVQHSEDPDIDAAIRSILSTSD
ncbi:unnamed protein product [Trichobilharzia szidati]|nr:unnamed protein product [Trichobilharzia szidati]CAH8841811.1 unnamed protein product [Trichobilharzia szidati]CAH8841813.1 unnamed protein product [Trichobilharzia szidati]